MFFGVSFFIDGSIDMAFHHHNFITDKNYLIKCISLFDFKMPHLCNCCSHSKKKCIILLKFICHYDEGVHLDRFYSFMTFDLNWDKLVDAINCIKCEEAETCAHVSELFTCLNHLEKQKKLLCFCADKFLQSDLQTVEELEKQEKEEERNHCEAENDQCLLTLKSINLFNVIFDSLTFNDLSLLDFSVSDSSDHTAQLSSKHS